MEGRSSVDRDRLLDSARQKYQKALKADPKHKGALAGLADLYAKAGNKEQALATYQTALQAVTRRTTTWRTRWRRCRSSCQDWAGAVQSCQFALSLDPENRTYTRTLGYCQAQLGQYQTGGRVADEGDAGGPGAVLPGAGLDRPEPRA